MISIVIPVYNALKTIARCLNSILEQTYKDIEIICVDDQSKDESYKMLLDYQNKYQDKFIIFRNSLNSGPGYSRNVALKNIKGDHFFMIDADDYLLESDFLLKLYDKSIETQSDIVYGNLYIQSENGSLRFMTNKDLIKGSKYQRFASENLNIIYINNCLFNSRLLENVEYCTRRCSEDVCTMYKFLYYANDFVYCQVDGYVYVTNMESITHTTDLVLFSIRELITAYELYDFFKMKHEDSEIYNIFTIRNAVGKVFLKTKQMSYGEVKNMDKEDFKLFVDALNQHKDLVPYNQYKYLDKFLQKLF